MNITRQMCCCNTVNTPNMSVLNYQLGVVYFFSVAVVDFLSKFFSWCAAAVALLLLGLGGGFDFHIPTENPVGGSVGKEVRKVKCPIDAKIRIIFYLATASLVGCSRYHLGRDRGGCLT